MSHVLLFLPESRPWVEARIDTIPNKQNPWIEVLWWQGHFLTLVPRPGVAGPVERGRVKAKREMGQMAACQGEWGGRRCSLAGWTHEGSVVTRSKTTGRDGLLGPHHLDLEPLCLHFFHLCPHSSETYMPLPPAGDTGPWLVLDVFPCSYLLFFFF